MKAIIRIYRAILFELFARWTECVLRIFNCRKSKYSPIKTMRCAKMLSKLWILQYVIMSFRKTCIR